MPTYTVNVYGLFTIGSASSGSVAQRRARLNDDIRRANEIWRINGTSCINFVAAGTAFRNIEIDASSRTYTQALEDVEPLINRTRRTLNDPIAVYVVYLRGNSFRDEYIGGGGILVTRYNSPTDYQLIGEVVIPNEGFNTDIFAHEVGHALLTRLSNNNGNLFWDNTDPTGPYREFDPQTGELLFEDQIHSSISSNIMYPTISGTNRQIAPEQCEIARRSTIVIVED
ncbi:hypothetical protein [Priestia megaterium]|uniref:hypothetical protein n=1 Tax=Priestia megaterium TaxID=1404 RepID=UPI002E1C05B4|nr:hypothetical protein [Priestia megaterium]